MAKEDVNKLTYYIAIKNHPKISDSNLQMEEIVVSLKQKVNQDSDVKNLLKLQKWVNNR